MALAVLKKLRSLKLDREGLSVIILVLKHILCFGGALLLSLSLVFDGLSPFGIPFVMSMPLEFMFTAGSGAMLGFVIGSSALSAFRYIISMLLSLVVFILLRRLFPHSAIRVVRALSVGFCVTAVGTAALLGSGFSLEREILCMAEGLISGGFTYFLSVTAAIKRGVTNYRSLTASELTGIVVTAAVSLLSLSGIGIGAMRLSGVIAAAVIILAARYGKEGCGAAVGVCMGAVLGIGRGNVVLTSCYAVGGLAAGLASSFGRFPSCLCFIIGSGIMLAASGDSTQAVPLMLEAAIASIAVILIPKRIVEHIRRFFVSVEVSPVSDGIRRLTRYRLKLAAATAASVSQSVVAVSKSLARLSKSENELVFEAVKTELCRSCKKCANCWEYNLDATLNAFNEMIYLLKSGRHTAGNNVPRYFAIRCKNIEELTDTFNRIYCEFTANSAAEARVSEARSLAADQFMSLSVMLHNLSDELSCELDFDREAAAAAAAAAEGVGLLVIDSLCVIEKNATASLRLLCLPSKKQPELKRLAAAVSQAVGLDFSEPTISETEDGKLFVMFCERPVFCLEVGSSQYCAENESVSGDALDYFDDGRGRFYMLISDGMGTGKRAAVDGMMTMSLARSLLKAGFSFECVIKIVNSALMCKSKEESLATLDVSCIDLYSGDTVFCKAGAAPTLLYRRGRLMRIERSSMPLGILREIGFERARGSLSDGDILIMMSDGLLSLNPECIRAELINHPERSASETAMAIARLARETSSMARNDDVSVLVGRLHLSSKQKAAD